MPFKDAAARREYMKKYRAEYREGKRRAEVGAKVPARTLTARAMAVKRRKRLWEIQNHEWRMDQQRERRRAARADEAAALLQVMPTEAGRDPAGGGSSPSGGSGSSRQKGSLKVSKHDKNKPRRNQPKAA